MPPMPRESHHRSPEGLQRDADELSRQLTQLSQVFQFRDRNRTCYRDLSVTQCHVLTSLIEHEGLSLKQLAADLCLDKSTTSRAVTSLIKKGYVHRATTRQDRRTVRLSATEAGRAVHKVIEDELVAEYREILRGFDSDVRLAMIRLFARLVRAVSQRFALAVPATTRNRGTSCDRSAAQEHMSLRAATNNGDTDSFTAGSPDNSNAHESGAEDNAGQVDNLAIVLRAACAGDFSAVRALVAAADLPVAGLENFFGDSYVIAQWRGRVVAVAGMEVYGSYGLMRSVAVDNVMRGNGLGRRLVVDRLRWAAARQLSSVYLLTTTAAPFFEQLGFRTVERDAVPPGIRSSVEFSTLCPASATVMVLKLED